MVEDGENAATESTDLVQQSLASNTSPPKIKWTESWPQVFACCIAHCLVIQVGATMSFSAIMLPQLEESQNNRTSESIRVSVSEASWIASLLTVSLPIGSLTSGSLMDRFGRRSLCIISAAPFFASWLLHATASQVWHLYFARVLAGIAGGFSTAALVYVTEISHPSYRAMLLSLNTSFVSLGILLTCVLGYFLNWRTMAYIFSGITFGTFCSLWTIPECPVWILSYRNDERKCKEAMQWLYRKPETCRGQLEQLSESAASKTTKGNAEKTRLISEFKQATVYKPFLVLFCLFVFQQLSGIYAIVFYAVNIFRTLAENSAAANIDEYACVVFLGVIRLFVSFISVGASRNVGRRPLLITSGLGMALCGFGAGITSGIASVAFALAYISFGTLGYVIVPWSLIGELLPLRVRGTLAGVMIALTYLLMFAVVKSFPYVLKELEATTVFYAFCAFNVLGTVFVYWCLPETRGKSFEEIEKHFRNN